MSGITIVERQVGDVTILDLDGKLTINGGAVELRKAIRRLLGEGKKKILLNLAGVSFIDSSGTGELVSSLTAIRREGGIFKFHSLTQKTKDLFTITRLLTVFDTYDDEEKAIASFGRPE